MYIFKKIGKTSLSILLLSTVLLLQPLSAQDADYTRMEQDLKMMKKVLSEVFRTGNPDSRNLTVRSRNTDAQYIQGFGIVMHTPLFYTSGRNNFTISRRTHSNQSVIVWPDKDHQNAQGQGRVIEGKATAPKSDEDHDNDHDDDRDYDDGRLSQSEIDDKKIDLMTYFLMNYGDLATELPKDEKILLVYGPIGTESSNTITIASIWSDEEEDVEQKGPGTITVSVDKKDIDRFRRKELSEEGFEDVLEISNLHPDNQKRMAYHILGQILQDVVGEHTVRTRWEKDNNLGRQYKIATDLGPKPKISYEILAGYGAVYQVQMRSSLLSVYGNGKGGRNRVYIDGKEEISERSDKQIDSTYQKMVPEVQKAMIEYGRTLRDLGNDEWLSVKIDIPSCETCDSPSVVEINVPQKVLEEYDRRSISLDTAIGRMEVRGKGQAKDKPGRSNYIYFGNDGEE